MLSRHLKQLALVPSLSDLMRKTEASISGYLADLDSEIGMLTCADVCARMPTYADIR
jgi:hypothetical protein